MVLRDASSKQPGDLLAANGSTDCLASLLDRSLHLLLQLPGRSADEPPAGNLFKRGDCRRGIDPRRVVRLPCDHQLPGDAGHLIGERHGGEFGGLRWISASSQCE